jgi:enamine deaminase RidA (YjgF/YER057c/UK114 family)
MSGKSLFQQNIDRLGIVIPNEVAPAGNYIGCNITGNLAFTAGQVPVLDDVKTGFGKVGILGDAYTTDQAYEFARLAGLMVLSRLRAACIEAGAPGNDPFSIVKKLVKITGFVNSEPDFYEQPTVLNGARDLMIEVFGEAGRHSRSAVGVNVLPNNHCVEVEAIFELTITETPQNTT